MPSVNITISLPALPDNDVWWANSAAWQNYWNDANLTTNIDAATPSSYGVVKQASTSIYTAGLINNQDFVDLVIEGNEYVIPLQSNFNQLKDAFNKLNNDYQNLKTALKASGAITNAT